MEFESLKTSSVGLLSNKDLHFFYYDIASDELTGASVVYDWSEEVQSFIEKKGLIIEVKDGTLPPEFEEGTIFYKLKSPDESKAMAFFRHLRNAFAHYQVNRYNNDYYMKDVNTHLQRPVNTMIGRINCDDLQELCHLFLKQGELFEHTPSYAEESINEE